MTARQAIPTDFTPPQNTVRWGGGQDDAARYLWWAKGGLATPVMVSTMLDEPQTTLGSKVYSLLSTYSGKFSEDAPHGRQG